MVKAKQLLIVSVACLLISVGLFVFGFVKEPYGQEYHLRIHSVRPNIELMESVVQSYYESTGRFPDSLDSLIPAYVANVRPDPWGNDYIYKLNDQDFEIYSVGENGVDENKSGDDVILGEKYYACEVYGTNCPRSIWYVIKFMSLAFSAASTFFVFGVLSFMMIRRHYKIGVN